MFAAWRTYFERITGHGTVALLFEDLHWADSGMLDFIDHMLDWSLNVPILIVTLSRPELLDNRPGWGAGRRNFLALDLQPLDVECALSKDALSPYVTRLGPVGMMLQSADEATRARVSEIVLAAFEPYVRGAEVRFTAACWMVSARP